jgi:hypothetical protein
MIMTDNMLQFNKENFIPIRKENINSHYEFVSKVYCLKCRSSAREHTGLFIRAELRALKGRGGPLRKYQRQLAKTRQLSRIKLKF